MSSTDGATELFIGVLPIYCGGVGKTSKCLLNNILSFPLSANVCKIIFEELLGDYCIGIVLLLQFRPVFNQTATTEHNTRYCIFNP